MLTQNTAPRGTAVLREATTPHDTAALPEPTASPRVAAPSEGVVLPGLTPSRASALFADDSGATTAEYALITLGAAAFAGVLVVLLRSDEVRGILTEIIRTALSLP